MKKIVMPLLASLISASAVCMAKKPLDHSAFDLWESVKVYPLANDGSWAAYSVNPQQGDGTLTLRNTKSGKEIIISRGYNPTFSANSRWAVALIKPFYADTREAKIKKKKDSDMPQDSLAIINLTRGTVEKIPYVKSYKIGKEGGDWLAWMSTDTTYVSKDALKDSKAGRPLILRNLTSGANKVLPWVEQYSISKDGLKLAAYTAPHKSDSLATSRMVLFNLPDTTEITLLDKQKFYGLPVFDDSSTQFAFTASLDSVETGTKRVKLYRGKVGQHASAQEQYVLSTVNAGRVPHLMQPRVSNPEKRDSVMKEMHRTVTLMAGDSLFVNQYSEPVFSHDGRRLIIGVARPIAPDDTTIVDFEQAALDIWRWDSPMTPPQELKNLNNIKKHTFPVVINLESGKEILTTASELDQVVPSNRWDGEWVLIKDPSAKIVEQQWNYSAPEELYVLNINTGEKKKIGEVPIDVSDISPAGKYVYWFEDRNYYAYNIATGETKCISSQIEFPLWNEEQDIPMDRQPYGGMGWKADDSAIYVYDRYDIWQLDPTGQTAPINLTKGDGRKNNRRYRYLRTDPEKRFFSNGDEVLLRVFDYGDKRNGLATIKISNTASTPNVRILDKYKFTQVNKALNAPVYAYQKANFEEMPDVWIAKNNDFAKAVKVTASNPQKNEYNWGTAELVKWYAYNGDLTEGVLYKPEDFDPAKKYPMLVVFYERNSEELYYHYDMEPSWSWVNYPFYVSRGYIVFVPDVKYTPGIPGESAYNYICSGVEDLCKKYSWIDKDHIGIDGQSWGGYQTAYLITRTNMFACAGSGAPVSNMTSAFGGIRWGTGDSRQAQYECGQSRIGRNLWEAPQLYIANSPIFYADRVHTPLLIMHNDEDGAVPWYQGIEYFMALRRLGKPVWMLQYNGEAHNIRARKNRKDITIRLQQFFDHYLKGAPMPEWMKTGIPVLRKGQEMRTGLIED